MNKFRLIILTGWLLLPFMGSYAQDATFEDLKAVLLKMKALKTYSYETVTNAVFPNGQKDSKTNVLYMDGPGKRLCYKNRFEVLVLTNQWAYRADHRTKNVSIFDVVRYNDRYKKAMPELGQLFNSNLAGTFIDSVLLTRGRLASAKKKGDQVTFTIGFPPDSQVTDMVVVYNYARQLPEWISIKSVYKERSAGKEKLTSFELICSKYTTTLPESVFDVQQYFKVVNHKPVLFQYKNYKVSSIL